MQNIPREADKKLMPSRGTSPQQLLRHQNYKTKKRAKITIMNPKQNNPNIHNKNNTTKKPYEQQNIFSAMNERLHNMENNDAVIIIDSDDEKSLSIDPWKHKLSLSNLLRCKDFKRKGNLD